MAIDWIKMRCNLHDDPAVIGVAETLGFDEYAVVGRLHRLWSWADQQTRDGNAAGVTVSWIDRYLNTPGFAKALADRGWLVITDAGITIPKFERHNGKSGKQRALTSVRVSVHRAEKCNAGTVTKALPEKKRKDIHHDGDDADLKPMTAYLRTVARLDIHAGILDGLRKHAWTLDELRAAWQAITERKGVKNKHGLLSAKIVAGEKVKPVAITVSIGTTKAAEDKARAEMDTSSVPLGTQLKKALLGKVV